MLQIESIEFSLQKNFQFANKLMTSSLKRQMFLQSQKKRPLSQSGCQLDQTLLEWMQKCLSQLKEGKKSLSTKTVVNFNAPITKIK